MMHIMNCIQNVLNKGHLGSTMHLPFSIGTDVAVGNYITLFPNRGQ